MAIPTLPDIPEFILEPPRFHYSHERVINGVRWIYAGQYRCTVESWEQDARPKWTLIKKRRKTWQPNL
jgi:hypothetical protein